MDTVLEDKDVYRQQVEEVFKRSPDYKEPSAVDMTQHMPIDISNELPVSYDQASRDLWYTMLGEWAGVEDETPEEAYRRQVAEAENDWYAGLEKRLVSGKSMPTPEDLYSFRISYDKWAEKNLSGEENALEREAASNRAFDEIMSDPELYQYTLTGDGLVDSTNAMTDDLMLSRAIYNKTHQIDLMEEVLTQFAAEGMAGITGASATMWAPASGATAGGAVAGAPGAVVGALAGIGTMAAGMNETIYQYRKAKLGQGSSSVNTIGARFVEEYTNLVNQNLPKTELNQRILELTDRYFTEDNREYWGDLATVILTGERNFLDMGPITGLFVSAGLKGLGRLGSVIGSKFKGEALRRDLATLDDLQRYKEDPSRVYEGEIVSGQVLKKSNPNNVNTGLSKESVNAEANRYAHASGETPKGMVWQAVWDKATGNGMFHGRYRVLGSGTHSNVASAEFMLKAKAVDLADDMGTPLRVSDIDETVDGAKVVYLGNGADGTQPFNSYRQAEIALSRWAQLLKENQIPVIVERGPGQLYVKLVEMTSEQARRLPFKAELIDGGEMLYYGKGKKGEGITLKGALRKKHELFGKASYDLENRPSTDLNGKTRVSYDDVIVDLDKEEGGLGIVAKRIVEGKTRKQIGEEIETALQNNRKDIEAINKEIVKDSKKIAKDKVKEIEEAARENDDVWNIPQVYTNKKEQKLFEDYINKFYYESVGESWKEAKEVDYSKLKKWKHNDRIVPSGIKDKYHLVETRMYEQID
jgi:hypothetical protein